LSRPVSEPAQREMTFAFFAWCLHIFFSLKFNCREKIPRRSERAREGVGDPSSFANAFLLRLNSFSVENSACPWKHISRSAPVQNLCPPPCPRPGPKGVLNPFSSIFFHPKKKKRPHSSNRARPPAFSCYLIRCYPLSLFPSLPIPQKLASSLNFSRINPTVPVVCASTGPPQSSQPPAFPLDSEFASYLLAPRARPRKEPERLVSLCVLPQKPRLFPARPETRVPVLPRRTKPCGLRPTESHQLFVTAFPPPPAPNCLRPPAANQINRTT